MSRRPWLELVVPTALGVAACAACYVVPLVGLAAGAASTQAGFAQPLELGLLGGAGLTAGVVGFRRWRARSRSATDSCGSGTRSSGAVTKDAGHLRVLCEGAGRGEGPTGGSVER